MKRLMKAFIYSVILAFLSLFSVSLLWSNPMLLTASLIVLSVVMLAIWRNKEDIYLYVVVSITGALAEAFAIFFGVWTYALPDIIGIPIWLPFLWGLAGVFIKKISLEINNAS